MSKGNRVNKILRVYRHKWLIIYFHGVTIRGTYSVE